MNSPITYPSIDDKDLDDAALWAVIDSAAAAASSTAVSKYRKPLVHKNSPIVPFPIASPSPQQSNKTSRNFHNNHDGGEVLNHRPQKISRLVNDMSPEMAVVKHVQRTPSVTHYSSPETRKFNSPVGSQCSPVTGMSQEHSLTGRFPTVSLFKEYQNAAMAILEKSDYTMISGSPFIKKAGWRKISFYFNLSYEIKDKTIEFDEDRNVLRAEFIVRAYMQGGRFSDGWGSCERREKRFLKPNHDIPSTAETRAKNKACQDLLGIGEYRPGVSQSSAHR